MPANRTVEIQDDFSAGMFRDVAPHLIPSNGVYDLINRYLLEDGSPTRRGGTAYYTNAGLGSSGLTWVEDLYMVPGQRTVFANAADFGAVDSDNVTPRNLGSDGLAYPKQWAYTEDVMFIGGGYIYGGSRKTANYTTGTISTTNGSTAVTGAGTTWNTATDAGMLLQVGNERVYVVESITDTTHLVLSDPYEGSSAGGKSYTLYPIYKMTTADPYEVSDFYTVANNRLVWASGNAVSFAPLDGTTKLPKNHSAHDANDTHTLPQGVNVVGLANIGGTVLAFTTAGVWSILGLVFDIVDANGNAQHRVENFSKDVVLFGAAGIAGWHQQLIVPALDGIYLMDGTSQPTKISRPIDKLYTHYIQLGYQPGQAKVFRGHYLLPIIDSASNVIELFVCRLDRPIQVRGQTVFPWSRFNGDGGEIPSFAVRSGAVARDPVLLGAQKRSPSRIVDCSAFFDPDATHKNDADGTTPIPDTITRAFGDGNLSKLRKIRVRHELVDAASDDPQRELAWGDGSFGGGFALFDVAIFDTDVFAEDVGLTFHEIGNIPESDGRDPDSPGRINKRVRYFQIRDRGAGPAATDTLRSIEIDRRPMPSGGRK